MTKDRTTLWIIGAGNFGTKAVERLCKKEPTPILTVVDHDAEALERLSHLPAERACQDGVSYLESHLDTETAAEWIMPAVPIHLAFEWVRCKLSDGGRVEVIPVPLRVEAQVPNPVRGPDGQLFVSYADFVCPGSCTEPFDKCTFTGKPRKGLMYRTLQEVSCAGFFSAVIRSHQLAPGVGGIRPKDLVQSLGRIRKTKDRILFSTACLCHGVIHALEIL